MTTQFIKLTKVDFDGQTIPAQSEIWVNWSRIESFHVDDDYTSVCLYMPDDGDGCFLVKESPAQILALIDELSGK